MVLFICKGNIYRSRFAAAYYGKITGKLAISRGTHYWENNEVPKEYIEYVKEHFNLDVCGHVYKVTKHILKYAEKVYYMSKDNLDELRKYEGIYNINHISQRGVDIPDPGYKPDLTKATFMQEIKAALDDRRFPHYDHLV